MKLPAGLLLLCLALTVSSRAEEVKKSASEAKQELVWPEIKDPQALIEFAKGEIKRIGDSTQKWGPTDLSKEPEIADLRPMDCIVSPEYLVFFWTHTLSRDRPSLFYRRRTH